VTCCTRFGVARHRDTAPSPITLQRLQARYAGVLPQTFPRPSARCSHTLSPDCARGIPHRADIRRSTCSTRSSSLTFPQIGSPPKKRTPPSNAFCSSPNRFVAGLRRSGIRPAKINGRPKRVRQSGLPRCSAGNSPENQGPGISLSFSHISKTARFAAPPLSRRNTSCPPCHSASQHVILEHVTKMRRDRSATG